MGGIADYSGANVCEAVLGRGMLMALQARTDRTLRIRSVQVGPRSLPVETRIPLDYFASGDAVGNYAQVRELCHANPIAAWAAYIGGSIFTLLKEESVELPYGFSFLLLSAVPMNVGIGSSAAVEIGTLSCLNAYLGLEARRRRASRGSGRWRRTTSSARRAASWTRSPSRADARASSRTSSAGPARLIGEVEIPPGTGFVGINSMVRHSVAGNAYGDVRIGAFMGKKNHQRNPRPHRPRRAELSHGNFAAGIQERIRKEIPETILGSDFLAKYKTHDDPVTTIQPDATYRVVGPTRHPVEENERVLKFMEALNAAKAGDERRS